MNYDTIYQDFVNEHGEIDDLKFGHLEISKFMRKEYIVGIDKTKDDSIRFCFFSEFKNHIVLISFKNRKMEFEIKEIKK